MTDMHVSDDGRLTVDHEADAAYLYLSGVGEVDRTVMVDAVTNVDVDPAGYPVGVELLSLTARVPVDLLAQRFGLTVTDLAPLLQLDGM